MERVIVIQNITPRWSWRAEEENEKIISSGQRETLTAFVSTAYRKLIPSSPNTRT